MHAETEKKPARNSSKETSKDAVQFASQADIKVWANKHKIVVIFIVKELKSGEISQHFGFATSVKELSLINLQLKQHEMKQKKFGRKQLTEKNNYTKTS